MLERLLVAGAGGQGIILTGKMLANLAVKKVPHITFFPAYGAEVRGGTSNCQVVFSSEEIGSPVSDEFDSMIIMNQASLDRFLDQALPDSLVIVNSSMCEEPSSRKVLAVPATDMANDMGNPKVANFIVLGAYLARRRIIEPEEVVTRTREMLAGKAEDLIELNLKAFRRGLALES
jgi:2-oxoglutarate ferredoxin oxidoreductase subunit gamma